MHKYVSIPVKGVEDYYCARAWLQKIGVNYFDTPGRIFFRENKRAIETLKDKGLVIERDVPFKESAEVDAKYLRRKFAKEIAKAAGASFLIGNGCKLLFDSMYKKSTSVGDFAVPLFSYMSIASALDTEQKKASYAGGLILGGKTLYDIGTANYTGLVSDAVAGILSCGYLGVHRMRKSFES